MLLPIPRMNMTFGEIGVRPELVAALSKQQITEPTAIQIAALPVLLAGRDTYLNGETGTGKTLAYMLPIFCRPARCTAGGHPGRDRCTDTRTGNPDSAPVLRSCAEWEL